ncbi:MAG: hypothetical protein Q7U75_18070 [Desulfobacterales bacterium]|nr:hypothetical protein [Desulfobacterales bacterium]
MERCYDGSSLRLRATYYLLLWQDGDTEHAWISDDLQMALARRASVTAFPNRVLAVDANHFKSVLEAWNAGDFDGVDHDMNFGTRGKTPGVDSVATVCL